MTRPWRVVGRIVGRLARLYLGSLRIEARQPDGSIVTEETYRFDRQIFALCERDALVLARITAGRQFTVLVAPGRDGDWASAALEGFGCRVVRGASRRGGVRAVKALIRELDRSAGPAAIVVDGPLGPAGQAKSGAVLCGQKTGRQVCPLGAAARPAIILRHAWSRLYVPLPFARVVIAIEPAVSISHKIGRCGRTEATSELTRRLDRARTRALETLEQVSLRRESA